MTTTNFTNPITVGSFDGANDMRANVPTVKFVRISQASPSATIPVPDRSFVSRVGFVPTSAFTGTDPVSAMNVTFTTGSQQMAIITASAATKNHSTTIVSAAVFDTSANITVTLSALSTTVFTGGGGRAYVEYITEG